ncbi:MAG: DUF1206 domain-containing protein [Rubrobacter sp.]
MSKGDLSEDARLQAKDAAQSVQPWMERLARFGYATEGAVYSLIGLLAAGAAFGTGGHATGQRGALEVVAGSPFGGILLSLIAVGFLGYALWRGVQTIADPDKEGTDLRALAKRAGYGVSTLVYVGLAFSAVGLLLGSTSEGGGSPDDWTALLLSWPLGQVLVVGVGIAVIGVGLRELYQAYKARFLEYLKLDEMGERVRRWIERWGRLGIAARGIVFGVVGTFLIRAALEYDPQEARGLGGALQTLAQQPLGPWLLGAVALGLVAYGLFMLSVARYRHINTGRVQ